MTETQHTKACWAMPECNICGLRKKPYGRDVGATIASYCGEDCPGYRQEPLAGHLWPGEVDAIRKIVNEAIDNDLSFRELDELLLAQQQVSDQHHD